MRVRDWRYETVPAVAAPTGRACNARTRPLIFKATRGLYEYFWMLLGFLYIGAVGLIYSTVCSILRLVLRGMPTAIGARRVTGLLLRIFFRMLTASGVLRVDLTALHALRGRCVIIA